MSPKMDLNIIVIGKTGPEKSTFIGSLLPNDLKGVETKDGPTVSNCYIFEKCRGLALEANFGVCP